MSIARGGSIPLDRTNQFQTVDFGKYLIIQLCVVGGFDAIQSPFNRQQLRFQSASVAEFALVLCFSVFAGRKTAHNFSKKALIIRRIVKVEPIGLMVRPLSCLINPCPENPLLHRLINEGIIDAHALRVA